MADERRVEMRDVSARTLWLLGLGLGCFIAASAVGLRFFFDPDSNWVFNRLSKPAPTLQIAPRADYAAFAARKNAMLSAHGVPDPVSGIVQVPIEEAMRLVSEGHRAALSDAEKQAAQDCAGASCPGAIPSEKTIR